MAARVFCNGCGREVEDGPEQRTDEEAQVQRFHVVEARRAGLAGSGQPLGIASEATVRGDLCDDCWETLAAFVGDTPHQEARETMRGNRPHRHGDGGVMLAQV